MKNRITVEIVKSTAKAHFVKDAAGRTGWIQARWLKADFTVSAETFENAVCSAQERAADLSAQIEAEKIERNYRDSYHAVRVARETEKAVACEIVIEFAGSEETKLVWFPKSLLGGGDGIAEIPGWLIREKISEALSSAIGTDYYSRHRASKGELCLLVRGLEILENVNV